MTRRTAIGAPFLALAQPPSTPAAAPREFGFRPAQMSLWDTWHIEHAEMAHMFYLQRLAQGSTRTALEADTLGHAVSRDLIHWTEKDLVLGPGPAGGLDDMQPYTGCVVHHDGRFHLYYAMRSKADAGAGQRIGLALSADLDHWDRYSANPLIEPDPRWYVSHRKPLPNGVVDCRDLVIIKHPSGDGWLGFYAARVPSDELGDGAVIAAVRSKDLLHWEHLPPAFAPGKYACIEVPDVYMIDGRWYMTCLTGHEYGKRAIFTDPHIVRGTIYAVAERPEGPYHEFSDDNVLTGGDNHTGYSCRGFVFQGERHVFYTQPVPGGPAILSPPMRIGTDAQKHLRLVYSPRTQIWRRAILLDSSRDAPAPRPIPSHYRWTMPAGTWRLEGKTYAGHSRAGYQIADLGLQAPAAEIEARIRITQGAAAGFLWGVNPGGRTQDMVFMLDVEEGCVRAGSRPFFNEPYVRRFALEHGRVYHVRIAIRPPRFELFVDDMLTLQFASTAVPAQAAPPTVGLFVDRATAQISDLRVYSLDI